VREAVHCHRRHQHGHPDAPACDAHAAPHEQCFSDPDADLVSNAVVSQQTVGQALVASLNCHAASPCFQLLLLLLLRLLLPQGTHLKIRSLCQHAIHR
jgi:hypothetical protein